LHILKIIRIDITEKIFSERKLKKSYESLKQLALHLKHSEANLHSIFDNSDTGFIVFDINKYVVTFNTLAQEFVLRLLNKFLEPDTNLSSYFLEEYDMTQLNAGFDCAVNGKKYVYDICMNLHDGTEYWLNQKFFPIFSANNTVIGILNEITDITEQKLFEKEREKITEDLIQRNNDLEQFTYIVSHNLRSPVANIKGFNDILNTVELKDTEKNEMLNGINISVNKLDNVIQDLNQILQVKHNVNEKKEEVKFSDMVKTIKSSIQQIIDKDGVVIKYDFSETDEMLTLKSYMYSIFYNLISNSIKYRRPDADPIIEIQSKKDNNKIILSFKDNGLGIDLDKKRNQIFGLYKRFHTHTDGKGVGLYMTKTQVETLGGRISVNSEVNKGTEFIIEFVI